MELMRDLNPVFLNVLTVHGSGQHMFRDMLTALGFWCYRTDDFPDAHKPLVFSIWPDVQDRHGLPESLRALAERKGYEYKEIIFSRHPVDVFLSRMERGTVTAEQAQQENEDFFFLTKGLTVPVVRYEDLCAGEFTTFLDVVSSCGVEDAAPALAIPYDNGGVRKWERRPFKKLRLEIGNINRVVVRGDYTRKAAFQRHRNSLPAAIYLRLLVQWPPFKKNYVRFFEGISAQFLMRPLWRRFSGLL